MVEERKQSILTFKEKASYGIGAFPAAAYGAFLGQIQAFYYAWMGLSAFFIIIAQIIYAIWNVINDPIFGILQDRTRTKRGRYLPWIMWFAPVLTASFIAVFYVPDSWRYAVSGDETQFLLFIWYLLSLSAYDLAFTIVFLAHSALLPQITDDFNERTQTAVLATIFGALGGVVAAILPVLFLTNPTPDKIALLRLCVFIFGIGSFGTWFVLLKYVKERMELIPKEKEPALKNIGYVFKNPACRIYMVYDGVTVAINQMLITGLTFIIAWTIGFENPYGLNTLQIGDIIILLIFPLICLAIGVVLQFYIPKHRDLKALLLWDLVFMFVGFMIAYFGALPSITQSDVIYETPPNLWLVSLGLGIALLGFLGNMIYLNPLNADVVDFDEYRTGSRRESVYSGVNCVISKLMYSVVMAIYPAILAMYGLLPASPEDITSNALIVADGFKNAITGVAIASFLIPALFAIIGFISFIWYPLNGRKLKEIRAFLEEKHFKERLDFEKK